MPLTTLDPKTALIVVDLQKGVAAMAPGTMFDVVVERSRALADGFRTQGLPVVLVTVDGVAPGRTEQPTRHTGAFPPGFTASFQSSIRNPATSSSPNRPGARSRPRIWSGG